MKAIRTLLACIRKADQTYNLINHGDKIVVGLSGGKDSMALLYYFLDDPEIVVAHFNHGTRKSADDDEKFVRNFCEKNKKKHGLFTMLLFHLLVGVLATTILLEIHLVFSHNLERFFISTFFFKISR